MDNENETSLDELFCNFGFICQGKLADWRKILSFIQEQTGAKVIYHRQHLGKLYIVSEGGADPRQREQPRNNTPAHEQSGRGSDA